MTVGHGNGVWYDECISILASLSRRMAGRRTPMVVHTSTRNCGLLYETPQTDRHVNHYGPWRGHDPAP